MRNVTIIDQHGSRWQCDEAVMSCPGLSLRTSCPAISLLWLDSQQTTYMPIRCWGDAGPASKTVAQHHPSIGSSSRDCRELWAAKGQGELDWRRPAICINWLHTITVLPTKYLSNTRILHRVNTFISLFTLEWGKYNAISAADNWQARRNIPTSGKVFRLYGNCNVNSVVQRHRAVYAYLKSKHM